MNDLRERIVNFTVALGERVLPPLERWLGNSSLVGDQPFRWQTDFDYDWSGGGCTTVAAKRKSGISWWSFPAVTAGAP